MVRLNNKEYTTSETYCLNTTSDRQHQTCLIKFFMTMSLAFLISTHTLFSFAEQTTNQSLIFLPDYLYPDERVKGAVVEGKGEDRHFSAYGLDNSALEISAAHFFDTSLNTTQRLMNHNWIYQSYHDIELESGSRFFSNLLKSSLKTYWQSFHQRKLAHTVLPDATGTGTISEFDYKMRLKDDSIKVSVKYEF